MMKKSWRDNGPILETDTEIVFYDPVKDILWAFIWNGQSYDLRILCPYSEEGNRYICESLKTEF